MIYQSARSITILFMALITIQTPFGAFAQHHGHYGNDMSDETSHSPLMTPAQFKKFEAELIAHPHAALDMLVHSANESFKKESNGMKKFNIILKYSSNLPGGKTTLIQLLPTNSDKMTLQILVHESVKSNPFFLLDAVVELKNIYNINDIGAFEMLPVQGHPAYSSHPHDHNTYFKYVDYSLKHSFGVPEEAFSLQTLPQPPIEILETMANANGGSIFAQRRLAQMESNKFQIIKKGFLTFTPIKNLTEEQKKMHLLEYAKAKGVLLSIQNTYELEMKKLQDQIDLSNKKSLDTLNAEAKKVYRQQIQDYKAGADERNQLVKEKSLSEMVKTNDRQGVAQAMEKMLPWAIMEPTEKSFWNDFVEAIRHPNYENAPILFRGMDQDEKFQAVTDKLGKVAGGGLFSKRLTAGSGSHLFKLKGLPETFETFGTYGSYQGKRVSPLTLPHTLTKMMLNHASYPNGSPFISLTYSLPIAFSFATGNTLEAKNSKDFEKSKAAFLNSNASGGVVTLRIDPRRLITNSISPHTGEIEVLASLLIFPDEVLYMEKGVNYYVQIPDSTDDIGHKKVSIPPEEYYARARQAVYQKTGVILPQNYNDILKTGKKEFAAGLKELGVLFDKVAVNKPILCESVFR